MSSPKDGSVQHSKDGLCEEAKESGSASLTPDSGIHDLSGMDPVMKAKWEEEWKTELAKVEDDITILKQTLDMKMQRRQELKRKLGITVWKDIKDDMEQGIRTIQESTAYQKTSQTIKSAGEKTSEALGSFGASMSKKIEEIKKSSTVRSLEEKVGSAYTNVKTKVGGSNQGEAASIIENADESSATTERHPK